MVMAYTTASKNAATIAAANGVFAPPAAIPDAAADWFQQLTQPGVAIGGSHPFLDPSGYRADMIFQLTQDHYLPHALRSLVSA
jgi:ABC-type molybdate transport system substrate-binding protein